MSLRCSKCGIADDIAGVHGPVGCWNCQRDIKLSQLQKERDEAVGRAEKAEGELHAWHRAFQTVHLSHVLAARDRLEADKSALREALDRLIQKFKEEGASPAQSIGHQPVVARMTVKDLHEFQALSPSPVQKADCTCLAGQPVKCVVHPDVPVGLKADVPEGEASDTEMLDWIERQQHFNLLVTYNGLGRACSTSTEQYRWNWNTAREAIRKAMLAQQESTPPTSPGDGR